MNILLITHFYPPLNTGGVFRPYTWAKYWSGFGHHVTVLTTKKHPSHGNLDFHVDPDLTGRLHVHEVDYGFSREKGQDRNIPPKPYSGGSVKQKFKYLIRGLYFDYLGLLMERYLLWIFPAIAAGRVLARERPFDVIVSTFTPGASHWIARSLKMTWGIPWMADFRDLWSGNPAAQGVWPFSTLVRALERTAVAHADILTTVSDPLRAELASIHGKPCITLENGFDDEEFEDLGTEKFYPEDGKLRFVYAGAIYPGKRDPSPLFAAVRELISQGKLHPDRIELLFYGSKPLGIREMARRFDVDEVVKTPGHIDRRSVLRAQRDADGLIFLEWDDPSTEGILTGKLFEYLRSGRPILGIGNTPTSASSRLMSLAGVGFPLGKDVRLISSFLVENYIDGKMPRISPQLKVIDRYSRKTLAKTALGHLEEMVANSRRRNRMP